MGHLHRPQSQPHVRPPALPAHSCRASRDDDALTRLIGRIYDAALDPASWTGVLAQIGEFVGGRAGGIVFKDAVTKAGTPYHHFGVDPRYVRIYSDTHSRFDPVSTLPRFDVE